MDLATVHRQTVEEWQRRVEGVREAQWSAPTPCADWDVRALVNHVVGEELWAAPLLEGQTIEQVGDRFDGDVLGEDPVATGREASARAAEAADRELPRAGIVHLSYGEESMAEYVHQLAADHLVHGWDLAAATGQDRTMPAELVEALAPWFAEREELYRGAGIVAPRVDTSSPDPQTQLLAGFGRAADWNADWTAP